MNSFSDLASFSRLHYLYCPSARAFAQALEAHFGVYSLEECDVIVVLGGDGFMLHRVHQYMALGKPFYGLNFGTRGALMNPQGPSEFILQRIRSARAFSFHPLAFEVHNCANEVFKGYAINEITIHRMAYHTVHLSLYVNDQEVLPRAEGDGLLIATPLGSSAYNASAGGPVLQLDVPGLVLTPLHFCAPKGWNSRVIHEDAQVLIRLTDPMHRSAYVGADIVQHPSITQCRLRKDPSLKVTFLFDQLER